MFLQCELPNELDDNFQNAWGSNVTTMWVSNIFHFRSPLRADAPISTYRYSGFLNYQMDKYPMFLPGTYFGVEVQALQSVKSRAGYLNTFFHVDAVLLSNMFFLCTSTWVVTIFNLDAKRLTVTKQFCSG